MKKILLLATIMWCGVALKAQNPAPPASFEIFTEVSVNDNNQLTLDDLLNNPNVLDSLPTLYNVKAVMNLLDTTHITTINVKLEDAGINILDKTFTFDGPATNADGTTYSRNGSVISLGLGEYLLMNYIATVKLTDNNTNQSIPKSFVNQ